MPERKHQFTEDELGAAVRNSATYSGVLRILGIKVSGGYQSYLKRRIAKAGLDISHFTQKGKVKMHAGAYTGSERHLANLAKARNAIGQRPCQWCGREVHASGLMRHESLCHLALENIRSCPVCDDPIRGRGETCSKACANTHFRSGSNHPNWKTESYRSTCFSHHEKKCVVCDEVNIVEVHHLDENHENNDPANLIPLCPTHHKYWHSRFRVLIEEQVMDYASRFTGQTILTTTTA
ncbi:MULTISPECIES: HNH endonuclease [unclassified Mesorhizobium]|uniref:HNH endonuclease n=1 Tax=Mesorhizobium TaxID=68287 RepID=UPI0007A94B17|nr:MULTISPECIES: HNH endonuclease [unclassified Mesorhizobium]AMX93651.1 hypothetical protein A4R28_11350 [Mesorhizobium ciceri]RVB95933.1 HNH endonuclease [Mesorhizobium sp. M7A.F.Ca.AU.002.04.1.1]MDF3208342.1 HNH endonuclease [Mesorhizobium sp. LMG15046]RUU22196.1 HNH endonuclease [Mesorhizobium sp. Primo-B]RUU37894.1 HNH endonuclease [Mesorhizobium sp. Primo-A]